MLSLNRLDVHQPLGSLRIPLSGHSSVSQSFVAGSDNLNIVSICVRNPARVIAPLEFRLHEATASAIPIRSIPFSTANIAFQDCTRFQFEPVVGSAEKLYVASIYNLADEKLSPLTEVYVEADRSHDYQDGQAYLNLSEKNYDLHFKTSFSEDLGSSLRGATAQFVHRLASDPVFFVFYLALLLWIIKLWLNKSHDK